MLRRVLFGLVLLIAALGGLLVFLVGQSEWLGRQLAGLLSTPVPQLREARLSGLPFSPRIEGLEVCDRNGPWLSVEQAELQWRLGPLWHDRRLEIDQASLRGVIVWRAPLPAADAGPSAPATGLPEL